MFPLSAASRSQCLGLHGQPRPSNEYWLSTGSFRRDRGLGRCQIFSAAFQFSVVVIIETIEVVPHSDYYLFLLTILEIRLAPWYFASILGSHLWNHLSAKRILVGSRFRCVDISAPRPILPTAKYKEPHRLRWSYLMILSCLIHPTSMERYGKAETRDVLEYPKSSATASPCSLKRLGRHCGWISSNLATVGVRTGNFEKLAHSIGSWICIIMDVHGIIWVGCELDSWSYCILSIFIIN